MMKYIKNKINVLEQSNDLKLIELFTIDHEIKIIKLYLKTIESNTEKRSNN